MYDLIVIGGGPAGTSAAITLAKAGVSVLLLERGAFPRHKVCGEFVSAESLDLLDALLDSTHKSLLSQAIRIVETRAYLDGQPIETAIDPAAVSIARLDLDAALWESAQQCGIDCRQKVTAHSVVGTSPFRVMTSAGDFESRVIVDASGRWSNLNANRARPATSTGKWLGIKAHFREPDTRPSADLYFFDGGYCGVQPVSLKDSAASENRINACAMVRTDVAGTMQEVFKQHPQLQKRARKWKPLSDPVSTSPLFFRDPQPVRDGILVAGDAAVFVDPFVGDGISLALRSGALAAQSLIPFFHKEISVAEAAESYQRAYLRRLAPVFKASSMIRRMLELPRAVRTPMIYLLRSAPALSRYLVRRTR